MMQQTFADYEMVPIDNRLFAREVVEESISEMNERVLRALKSQPMTRGELEDATGLKTQTLCWRLRDLLEAERIVKKANRLCQCRSCVKNRATMQAEWWAK